MLSVAITRLMTFTNFLKGCSEDVVAESPVYEKALRNLCTMVAPMAPLMASEMWQGMNIGNDHQAVMSLVSKVILTSQLLPASFKHCFELRYNTFLLVDI